jgi:hypothetical protein
MMGEMGDIDGRREEGWVWKWLENGIGKKYILIFG